MLVAAGVMTLAACSASKDSPGPPVVVPQVIVTSTTVKDFIDPSSTNPCDALSRSDIASIFGTTVMAGTSDAARVRCEWVLGDGGAFVVTYPAGGPRSSRARAVVERVVNGAGWSQVEGVGDAAYLGAGGGTLVVVKGPLVFTVGTSGSGASKTADRNRLIALAKEYLATHSR